MSQMDEHNTNFESHESLGICLGASTIGLVRLGWNGPKAQILTQETRIHQGNARECLVKMLEAQDRPPGLNVAATGRKFRGHVALSSISEPEAVEYAAAHVLPEDHPYRLIVSAGGETFMVYHLDNEGRVQSLHTGNKCASGTGEFFLQQLGRMGSTIEEFGGMSRPEEVHHVSGRCSVFCKSDCTHALNKGVPRPQVAAGLARMMAGKILEFLGKLPKTSVMLVGGCTRNEWLVHYLREEIEDVFIPEEAPYFEALGAALWARERETRPLGHLEELFTHQKSVFSYLKPLSEARSLVEFKHQPRGAAEPGDRTIVGLDVGSTTTKGVVVRRSDKAILAAEYLRTNGDPVGASREVYRSLADQLAAPVTIEGLGVTGSGRQIAGLHALTPGVINEIVAHATAAVYFDPEVDTIFEIGGQDAKYTHLTNGVPSDYAMNEACSAGTGSFLEESAKESLGLNVEDIGSTAYEGGSPPNFNDQCAAFIGSDIKGAVQEGISTPDIVAGLVYSVCMNYANRVKGNRPVGKKVFMQGGVCYNEAVPAAMASLTGKRVVVPPEPGLMGAFGVALEVDRRMEQDLLPGGQFNLTDLAERDLAYADPFVCRGCDRNCTIQRVVIEGERYPFGGICNRFDNILGDRVKDPASFDLVTQREHRVYENLAPEKAEDTRPTVGLNRSFLVHSYFPLFNRFFEALGFRVVLPTALDPEGAKYQGAPFCFPVELAHGYAAALLAKDPDFIFLPHLRGIPSESGNETSCTCVFVQGEPFYLRTAFPDMNGARVLSPYLDLSLGLEANIEAFEEVARALGVEPEKVRPALRTAQEEQDRFEAGLRAQGAQALAKLDEDPEAIAVVLFGRPYNSFASEANKGIPAKLASRGVQVIPFDMLCAEDEPLEEGHNMYWGMGRKLLRAAQAVQKHPQLFGTYITNFSCGPDSFLVGFFRDIMGSKPSLTLELDNHTADAGIETRIEAFLDIVGFYRQTLAQASPPSGTNGFSPARLEFSGKRAGIRTSHGRWVPLDDERVRVIIPTMGRYGTPLLAKSFERVGVRALALPPADDEVLKLGRGNSTCKECLPLQTTVGSLLHYLKNRPEGEITAYLMASTDGPCRFGQYHVFSQKVIEKGRVPDVAVLSLTSTDGYGGLGDRFALAAWRAIIIGDLFDEMWSTILAGAVDPDAGLEVLNREHQAILNVMHMGWRRIARQLSRSAQVLAAIELKMPYEELPKVSLVGEIYVRRDPISLQNLIENMAERGFIVRVSETSEWIRYVNWLTRNHIETEPTLGFWPRDWVIQYFDRSIRKKLGPAGLFFPEKPNVTPSIDAGKKFIPPELTGEAILTVGSALREVLHPACGVISIGPFGCMPSRLSEAILSEKFTTTEKRALDGGSNGHGAILAEDRKLPFLAIETDGNAFPQLIEARLEAFCLQARRLHEQMREYATAHENPMSQAH